MQRYQVPERHCGRPTRQTIVAHVDNAADPQFASYDIDNRLAVLIGYPRPDSVQSNYVEFRQIGPRRKFGEGIIEQCRARSRSVSKALGLRGLHGVEIRSPEIALICGSVNVDRQ